MAWLFSCFRCKQKQHSRSSSPKANCKIAAENTDLKNTNVLEAQGRAHSSLSLEQNLDASKQGNDADRSLLSYFRTETECYSSKKLSSNQPLLQKEELQLVKEDTTKAQNLKSEANNFQDILDPSNNLREAFDVESEEWQAEKGRCIAHQHSLLKNIQSEGDQLLLSSTKNESQLFDKEDSNEVRNFASSSLSATQDTTAIISPNITLLERTLQNWRGCSSETKVKQSDRRRDYSFDSTFVNMEEPLVISRSKRSFKALSFSEFPLVEAAEGSKCVSEKLELEVLRGAGLSITSNIIDIHRMTTLNGETGDEISRNLLANVSSSSPATLTEQAVSFSLSQDVVLYDTDMEVDSKVVKPHSNESSHSRPCGLIQTLKNDYVHEVPSCADLIMQQSQTFTFEDSCNSNLEEISHLFTDCNSNRESMDEVVEELEFDQMSSCSDASSSLMSPLPQVLSEGVELFARKRAHLHATAKASAMPQASTTGLSAEFFDEPDPREINSLEQSSANIASMVNGYQLLPSKLVDNATSRQEVTESRGSMNMISESCTHSSTEHTKGITCNGFTSVENASFTVPSPETVTYMKKHLQSPPTLCAEELSTTQNNMPASPYDTPSVSKSISSMNFFKQQLTPRTPSGSSSQVETPSSIQSAVSPADLAKDRPIMGTVAAHWSHSSSKEKWDGKGIPNSTNKYKEDQKVSWHATPFEVRLERALAKQDRVFQKKLFGGAMSTEMDLRTEPITSSG